MSIASCALCGTHGDTDFDVEGYTLLVDGKEIELDFWLCPCCRENSVDEAHEKFLRSQYENRRGW